MKILNRIIKRVTRDDLILTLPAVNDPNRDLRSNSVGFAQYDESRALIRDAIREKLASLGVDVTTEDGRERISQLLHGYDLVVPSVINVINGQHASLRMLCAVLGALFGVEAVIVNRTTMDPPPHRYRDRHYPRRPSTQPAKSEPVEVESVCDENSTTLPVLQRSSELKAKLLRIVALLDAVEGDNDAEVVITGSLSVKVNTTNSI